MKVSPTPLEGVLVIEPRVCADERGFFLETYQDARHRQAGICATFVQDNHSRSRRNVVRGLHYRVTRPQAQLVTVIHGRVFDVVVDLRSDSPTFGRWYGIELSDAGPRQLFMAPGFAHGFCVLSDSADLHYKVTERYDPADAAGIRWNDPGLGIPWPVQAPIVTARDAAYPLLTDLAPARLPHVLRAP